MKLLIADDERLARKRLVSLIEEIGADSAVVVEAENGAEALRLWFAEKSDVVLLDIRMPVMNGIEVARVLARMDNPPAVIFTTAYDEYALQAFDASAIDYLLKPIRRERLQEALGKARVFTKARLAELERHMPRGSDRRSHLCAQIHGDLLLIPLVDVLYFQADQKYVTVRTMSREILIDEPLKSLEREFSDDFIRIHRNALVALCHVERLEKRGAGLAIKLRGIEDCLDVSRRHAAGVRGALRNPK
ncbi:MAG: LytTR family DNA-binding domain-containing protein [Pseudomonadota bacterium]